MQPYSYFLYHLYANLFVNREVEQNLWGSMFSFAKHFSVDFKYSSKRALKVVFVFSPRH